MDKDYVNTQAPLRSSENAAPIKIGTNSLASIVAKGADYVRHLADTSPIQLHNVFPGVKEGREADVARMSVQARSAVSTKAPTVASMYARGMVVGDRKRDVRVTIVQLHAGVTKSGTPMHKVVDSRGNSWLQSERFLEP